MAGMGNISNRQVVGGDWKREKTLDDKSDEST